MKKIFLMVPVLAMFASPAWAIADPCPNDMSIYFDTNADVYEFATSPYVIVPSYVILTNPDFDALSGYEFGYDIVGNYIVSNVDLVGAHGIDPTLVDGNVIAGLATPLPTAAATLLCTLSVFVMDWNPISFTLHGAMPNSVEGSYLPAVLLPDG